MDLTVHFGGVVAVDGVSLSLSRGEVSCIVGPNGAGKTTFLNAISGLVPLGAGRLELRGTDISGIPAKARARAGVSRTFQHPILLEDRTVAGNVALGDQVDGRLRLLATLGVWPALRHERTVLARARAACETVGLGPQFDLPVAGLPYGAKKLVDLARALVSEPDLLLLDEPFAGLTVGEKLEMERVVSSIAADTAVVMIEHDLDLVQKMADVVHVFNFGKLLASGAYSDVIRDPDVVAAYFGTGRSRTLTNAEGSG
ncbi:ABC transporter ATP-binding protein [Pseudonocardia sp. H11422]|uniref:ABC transporter ATP-binding protein n=1 Tax=Pseudonocardia sp. H11422 TaxID=2835866 RepID=UPI001BDC50C5|nr:ABC transporter ATP-binding protein [Pseudonocardia sp. H11422]